MDAIEVRIKSPGEVMVEIWLGIISGVVTLGGIWLTILKYREANKVEDNTKRIKALEGELETHKRLIATLQRQNALLRSENGSLLRLLTKYKQAAQESLIITDESGKITEWDAAATIMFGWNAEEAVGRDVSLLIVPHELRQEHRVSLANVFKHKRQPRTAPLKVKANTKNEELIDVEVQLLPGWETGDESGSWRYGARIKKLVLPSPEAKSVTRSSESDPPSKFEKLPS